MTRQNELAKFGGIVLFTDFSRTELEAFVELTDPVNYRAGMNVVKQDDLGDCMYIIVEGRMKVTHRSADGEVILAELGSGMFFGELSLIDELPRSADVDAITDCTLVRVPAAVMRALASVHPMAAYKLFMSIAKGVVARVRESNKRYVDTLMMAKD